MAELNEEQIQRIAAGAVRAALAQTTRLSREDASDLVAAAATKAVNEAHTRLFADLGYDLANKEDVKRLRATMAFTERLHMRCDRVGQSVANAIANWFALVIVGLIAAGFVVWLRGASPAPPPSLHIK